MESEMVFDRVSSELKSAIAQVDAGAGDSFVFKTQTSEETVSKPPSIQVEFEDCLISQFSSYGGGSFTGGVYVGDGDVDGRDFLVWQKNLGSAGGVLDNDAAADGARVPPYTPEWTDFNGSDPGVPQVALFDDWSI